MCHTRSYSLNYALALTLQFSKKVKHPRGVKIKREINFRDFIVTHFQSKSTCQSVLLPQLRASVMHFDVFVL